MTADAWTQDDIHDAAARRVTAFWYGSPDDSVAWALALCKMVNDPIADKLYIMHATLTPRYARESKEWAYGTAVDFAGSVHSGQRRRSRVESYRPDWGHQAARDGLAIALWPHLRDGVPGIGKRCEAFKCGKQGYQRVRDKVQQRACDLIAGFRLDMTETLSERFSRDFVQRWELATGAKWDGK
jgi:hypothetical protein